MDLFRYALLGFKVGAAVDDYLREDYVVRVRHLSRHATHEAHMWKGFCRFAETKQGVYYAEITPKHHVLELLAEHFRERFMNHPWIIHDKKHRLAAVYNGEDYIIESVPAHATAVYTDEEEKVQELWRMFFTTIGIKERTNKKLQRQNGALYFRGDMVEFKPKTP
jgi:probable DNA metabolism protein